MAMINIDKLYDVVERHTRIKLTDLKKDQLDKIIRFFNSLDRDIVALSKDIDLIFCSAEEVDLKFKKSAGVYLADENVVVLIKSTTALSLDILVHELVHVCQMSNNSIRHKVAALMSVAGNIAYRVFKNDFCKQLYVNSPFEAEAYRLQSKFKKEYI